MEVLGTLSWPHLAYSSRPPRRSWNPADGNPRFRVLCLQFQNQNGDTNSVYKPGFVDDLLLNFFRKKMLEEVGWDSEKLGYDGLVEVVNRLMMKGRSNLETEQSAVRILKSLFPPLLLVLFKMLIVPLGGGKLAWMMVARVTAWSCQWLMGASSVNSIDLPDGSSCSSGVFVERCKYLEESKCVGICINTRKLPTQERCLLSLYYPSKGSYERVDIRFAFLTFFKDYMGIPLYMEPKFSDYSCQFNFGVLPPPRASDSALHEPCLEICPNANRRKELNKSTAVECPSI